MLLSGGGGGASPPATLQRGSLRIDRNRSPGMNFLALGSGDRTKWAFYTEFKPSGLVPQQGATLFSAIVSTNYTVLLMTPDHRIVLMQDGVAAYVSINRFPDASRFYQILLNVDTSYLDGLARCDLTVDGVFQEWALSSDYLLYSGQTYVGSPTATYSFCSTSSLATGYPLDGTIARLIYADGHRIDASSVGEYDSNDLWRIKPYTGPLGVNGVSLAFDNPTSLATLGGGRVTLTNISLDPGVDRDFVFDLPEADGTQGNSCALNPYDNPRGLTLSRSNMRAASTVAGWKLVRGTHALRGGRFQFEITVGNPISGSMMVGLAKSTVPAYMMGDDYLVSSGLFMFVSNGSKFTNGSSTGYSNPWNTPGTVISVLYDSILRQLRFLVNGVDQGIAINGNGISDTDSMLPVLAITGSAHADINFGQRAFAYPLNGYSGINTGTIALPSIANPRDHFEVVTRIGTDQTRQQVSNLRFQPNLLFVKNRTAGANAVRLVGTGLGTTLDAPHISVTALSSFNADGYTLRDGKLDTFNTKMIENPYVDYVWKGDPISGVHSFDFSMPYLDGPVAIPHNLGVVPTAIMLRQKTDMSNYRGWVVWCKGMPLSDVFSVEGLINTINGFWVQPDASAIYVNPGITELVGTEMQVTVFADIPGFSKFGIYASDSSLPFVECGFQPRLVMTRGLSSMDGMAVLDTDRSGGNYLDRFHTLMGQDIESNYAGLMVTSTGFRPMVDGFPGNQAGEMNLFMAFAGANPRYPFGSSPRAMITGFSPMVVLMADSLNDPAGQFSSRVVQDGPAGWTIGHSVLTYYRSSVYMDGEGNMVVPFFNNTVVNGGFRVTAPENGNGDLYDLVPPVTMNMTVSFQTGSSYRYTANTFIIQLYYETKDIDTGDRCSYTARLRYNPSEDTYALNVVDDQGFINQLIALDPVLPETEHTMTFRLGADVLQVTLDGSTIFQSSPTDEGGLVPFALYQTGVHMHSGIIRDFVVV